MDLVHAWIVKWDETSYVGLIPLSSMYTYLDRLSEFGKYEVFATDENGEVIGHLHANKGGYCVL